jgi:hypothetical protein
MATHLVARGPRELDTARLWRGAMPSPREVHDETGPTRSLSSGLRRLDR